jgi:inorganic pyrophosphatase
MQEQFIARGTPEEFNVIIEIPAFSTPIKYEIDKKSGALFVDRFIATQLQYPTNYGYIPHSLSEDGDPADVLVITPFPLTFKSVIKCRPLGVLKMEDESGVDAKIIALPTSKICQIYEDIQTVDDLPALQLQQIIYFFEHYKKLEKGKWVKLQGIEDKVSAMNEIKKSFAFFEERNIK